MDGVRAEIISTGSEILKGLTVDTNAYFLSTELQKLGILPQFFSVVGDDKQSLRNALKSALERSDLIIITGGLGPTDDDINREVLANVFKKKLKFNKDAYKNIELRFEKRGFSVPVSNKKQAMIPEGAICLKNKWGTAAGFIIKDKNKVIVSLPGPPREMQPMFQQYVQKYVKKKFGLKGGLINFVIRTIGISESAVNEALKDITKRHKNIQFSLKAHSGRTDIILGTSSAAFGRRIKVVAKEINEIIGEFICGYGTITLEKFVGEFLRLNKLTIATAESCTGGLLASTITDVSGSSDYFIKGYVTYSNEAKIKDLGAKKETLKKYGAVSKQTASEMAVGARKRAKVDIAISTTGIAGPTGGTKKKPVGLVWFGLATPDGVFTAKRNFLGERYYIKIQTVNTALDLIRRYFLGYEIK